MCGQDHQQQQQSEGADGQLRGRASGDLLEPALVPGNQASCDADKADADNVSEAGRQTSRGLDSEAARSQVD